MTEDELAGISTLLSAERLATFVRLTGTERDALTVHDATILTASALMPVICLTEIALRNAVSERLRSVFGTPDWLTKPVAPFSWKGSEQGKIDEARRNAQRDAYTKLNDPQKRALDEVAFPHGVPAGMKYERKVKKRQQTLQVMHGQLIAQLTMFFWKRLFSSDYEETLWKRGLKELFPNKAIKRGDVGANLEVIYQARNRIAHHEPIYGDRLDEVVSSLDFIAFNLGNKRGDESSALAKLTSPHRIRLHEVAEQTRKLLASFVV